MTSRNTTTITCDRCGFSKEFPVPIPSERYNFWGKIVFNPNLGGAQELEYDLCQDCVRNFVSWRKENDVNSI